MRTDERFSGYRVLIGCFLVMFVHLGMLSSLGIFIPRMVPDLNETLGRVSLMTSFATIVAFVMSFITPKLLHKFSARVLLGVASVLCGIHFIMYGMAQNVYVLWAGASLGGVVLGCGTNAVIGTIISSWFIRKRSAIIGYVFGGAALGGAAVQFLGGRMIHAVGWRETYILLGVIGFAIALIANLLFIRDPQKLGQKPLGWEDAAVEHEKAEHVTETGVTAKAAMKTPSFWLLFVGIILAGFLITGFQSFAPAFWQENGMDVVQSSSYLSLYSLIGCVGVMIGGVVADKMGNRGFIAYILLAYIIGMFCATRYGANQSTVLVILTCLLIGLSYPASTSIPATVTTGAFGGREYAKICSYLMAALYFGKAIVSPVLSGIKAASGGLMGGFIALFAPIGPLVACAMAFIGIDFLSGVAASRAAARRKGHTWYFESCEAWRTVLKLGLTVTAIAMAWLIDSCVLDFMQLNVARLFTGFTCGVELWSFLENAAQLSDAPLFHWLRRYVRRRIRKEAGDE